MKVADKNKKEPVEWDDLIVLAEEGIERSELKRTQLRAAVRYFRSRKAAGEPCPVTPALVGQDEVSA